jgi:broad specificity phosphatase PhoE
MRTLILARHGHALSNALDVVSCTPPGDGLSSRGIDEALALREALAGEAIALGVATELRRTQETLDLALADRAVPRLVLPGLNEIDFGRFEGGPLTTYREWAWSTEPDVECPGGGESRASAAARVANALATLLARAEETILAIGHSLPIRYVLDAADGRFPAPRIEHVEHAAPYRLGRESVDTAKETLRVWSESPRF